MPDIIDYTAAHLEGTPDAESLNNLKIMTAAMQQFKERQLEEQNKEQLKQGLIDFGSTLLRIPAVLPDMAISFAHSFGENYRKGQDAIQAGTTALWDALEDGEKTLVGTRTADEDRPAVRYIKSLTGGKPGEHNLATEAGALGLEMLAGGALMSPAKYANWLSRHGDSIAGIKNALMGFAEHEGAVNLTDNAMDALAKMAHGRYSDLVRRAHAGDEIAARRVGKLASDPQVAQMLGHAELAATEAALKENPARWLRYKSRDIAKQAIDKELKIQALRDSGSYRLAMKELNGDFMSTPYTLRKTFLNVNNAQDVENLMKGMGASAEQYITKAAQNLAKYGSEQEKKTFQELLAAQKFTLKVNVGDEIIVPLNDAQAFGVNMLLNQIHQNMKASIRFTDEYAFSSKIDMLRFFKLLAMRQQVIANLTGREEGLTRLLGSLHTGYDELGDAVCALRIDRAVRRFPRISPVQVKKSATDDAWKVEAEEFSEVKRLVPQLEKMGAGVPTELSGAMDAARQALNTVDDEGLGVIKAMAAGKPVDLQKSNLPDAIKRLLGSDGIPLNVRQALAQRMSRGVNSPGMPKDVSWFTEVIFGNDSKLRRNVMKAVAGDVSRLDTAEQIGRYLNQVTRSTLKGRPLDTLYTHFINSILSNPLTHVVNAATNAAVALAAPASDVAAGMYRLLNGEYDKAARDVGMAAARVYSWLETGSDLTKLLTTYGIKKLPKNYQEVEAVKRLQSWSSSKLATMEHGLADYAGNYEVPSAGMSFGSDTIANMEGPAKAKYVATRLMHLPTRAMGSADAVFKAIAANSEQRARNWYAAWSQAKDVVSARKLYENLANSPSSLDRAQNFLYAEEATFQEELTERLENAVRGIQGNSYMRWVIPFIKTPLNIKRSMARSTGGLNLVPLMIDKIAPGKLTWVQNSKIVQKLAAGGQQAEAAIGQLALGNLMLGGVVAMNLYGKVTGSGGLPMPNERRIPYPKYTIFWNGKPFYYGRNEFLKWTLGLPITIKEIWHQVDWDDDELAEAAQEFFKGVSLAYTEALTDATFLTQASEALSGLRDFVTGNSDYYMRKTISRLIGGMIPFSGAYAFVNQRMYPMIRETHSYVDAFMNRYGMGYNRKKNPYSIDLFGQPKFHSLSGAVYPVNLNGLDGVTLELRRIRPHLKDVPKAMSYNFRAGMPTGRKYTAYERAVMRTMVADGQMLGLPYKKAVENLMLSGLYKMSNTEQKRMLLEHLNNQYVAAAEQQLLYQERMEPGVLETNQ